MTIDIRAKVICDLGEVISGGWSDDHVQGTGLIRTRGEVVLKGLHKPEFGSLVQLGYVAATTSGTYAVRMPRALRVLSSFADPFRRQTTIQLGCVLTLKENFRGPRPEDRTADTWNDPENANILCSLYETAPISISAAYVASVCADKLGLTYDTFPLTNWYTVEQFDLSPGYVQVLSDLLVSESYVGYIDSSEVLQIRSLAEYTGTYTVIQQNQIIDIGPINSGELPGSAVSVSYSYNRYKEPETLDEETQQIRDWEKDETVGPPSTVTIGLEGGGTYSRVVTPTSTVVTTYDAFDRVLKREETLISHVCVTNFSYIKWHTENPTGIINDVADTKIHITTYSYATDASELSAPLDPPPPGSCSILYSSNKIYDPEVDGVVLQEIRETYQSEMALAGALNIAEYSGEITTPAGGTTSWEYHPSVEPDILTEVVTTTYESDAKSGITKTLTTTQQAQALVQAGQQVGALEAEDALNLTSAGEVSNAIAALVARGSSLINLGTQVNTRTDRTYGLQSRPSRSDRNNDATRKSLVETTDDTVFIYGDETDINVVVYSVPYSPDDRIGEENGVAVVISESDAAEKAALYGRTQNNLAFGHRNGFSIQLAAPEIPPYPLDRISITASGLTGAYLCNGTSWSFDSNGIVCNTDALLVGGIGEDAE